LSQTFSKVSKPHLATAKRVIQYLRGCPNLGNAYKKGNFHVEGYVDVSFVLNPDKRRSTTGYIFTMGGDLVRYGSVT
ncbi:unnamed protein product, partial [Ascophyllum nodosum]